MTTTPLPARTAEAAPCCDEFARLSRRGLLTGGAALGATAVVGSAVITAATASAASAAAGKADSVLVVLSLRGAADGLSLVVPYSDPAYYRARPRIAIPKSTLLATDGTFGLHPELRPLLPLWTSGELAAVHATGLPAPNRSHFAAMEAIEDADPGSERRQGWLNRLVGQIPGSSPLQGFNLGGGVVPTSLFGPNPVMAAGDVDGVRFAGDDEWDEGGRLRSLHTLWDGQRGALGTAMRSAFDSVSDFEPVKATADNRTARSYPNSELGRALSQVARIVRGDVGVGVVTVDQGAWDMHTDVGTLEWGAMRRNAADLAASIAAFFTDLGSQRSKVTLVAFSEFGRRVAENDSWGLDHGYGNVMLLAGAGVKGGRYYGTMRPLEDGLDSDVAVTTDYRSVLSEVVTTRLGASRASVFPGFQPEDVGVMSSL
ncbi:DUF1501 domain-containing protein [Nocardioides marinquilinus]|uniref:DUF1501 domain-containing protein n=1 Tax=Nocardioides marinquilinus TaxID=1210400 RepID=A0ABP9Q8C6_9ACTN